MNSIKVLESQKNIILKKGLGTGDQEVKNE